MSSSQVMPGAKRKAPDHDDLNDGHTSANNTPPPKKRAKKHADLANSGALAQQAFQASKVKTAKPRSHKKKPAVPATNAPVNNGPVVWTRPWLSRPQELPEQTIWLIHCRDNLVPGATGPKDWQQVTAEFNTHFAAVQKKDLVYKTLQKKIAPKIREEFVRLNPEYPAALRYPVPNYVVPEEQDEGQEKGQEGLEDQQDRKDSDLDTDMSEADEEEYVETEQALKPAAQMQTEGRASPGTLAEISGNLLHSQAAGTEDETSEIPDRHPRTSSVHKHDIPVLDRVKFHLRRRTIEPVAFKFEEVLDDENEIFREVQYVDHNILADESPTYARYWPTHLDEPMPVPEGFCAKTLNAFCQMIAPVPATRLPTHYLWESKTPISGVFDRFGAIFPQKIFWDVDAMLELHAFAKHMGVTWICDIIIDRIHHMYTEQMALKAVIQRDVSKNGWVQVNDRQVPYFLPVADLEDRGVGVNDFESEEVMQIIEPLEGPRDAPTAQFITDMIGALQQKPTEEWYENEKEVSSEVRRFFDNALENVDEESCLMGATREEFCARYHKHGNAPCYTATEPPSTKTLLKQLYSTGSNGELLKLSKGMLSPTSLESVTYSQSDDMGELLFDNSTTEMLEAEKKTIIMEMKLEQAKMGLRKAHLAGRDEKQQALEEMQKIVGGK